MNERFQLLLQWLEKLPELKDKKWSKPVAASSDASFRRYYRIEIDTEPKISYIIMDAPVEFEDCRPFIKVSQELLEMGITVPEVIEQNLEHGFLLLSDLGSTTYLSVLEKASEETAEQLYQDALLALVTLQVNGKQEAKKLPVYDAALLQTEMSLFPDWLLNKHLEIDFSDSEKQQWLEIQDKLTKSALQQPQSYVHRDYHSRNLMVLDKGNPGVLDFQDAVYGAITYDAVSLLRDCYIAWPAAQVAEWQRFYFLALAKNNLVNKNDWTAFQKSMDLMGVQRHLKASGIFCRLYHRDGKDGYLNDIPLTLNYISEVARHYKDLTPLARLVEDKVLPQFH